MDIKISPFLVENSIKVSREIQEELNSNYQSLPIYMESLNMNTSLKIPNEKSINDTSLLASTSKLITDHESSDDDDNNDNIDDNTVYENNLQAISKSESPEKENLKSQHKLSNRRTLPPRRTKDTFYECFNKRRVLMKPKKIKTDLNLSEIKKIYLQKNHKFKKSNLETIYEEPLVNTINNKRNEICLIGTRKLRRSISLSDGLNINKTQKKHRRERIKKFFGRKKNHPRISLDDFLIKLNSSIDDDKTEIMNTRLDTEMNIDT